MNLKQRVAFNNGCGCGKTQERGSACDTRKVKSIARVGDDVIIAFDDCTYIAAPYEVVNTVSMCGVVVAPPADNNGSDTGSDKPSDNSSEERPDEHSNSAEGHVPIYTIGGEQIGEIVPPKEQPVEDIDPHEPIIDMDEL